MKNICCLLLPAIAATGVERLASCPVTPSPYASLLCHSACHHGPDQVADAALQAAPRGRGAAGAAAAPDQARLPAAGGADAGHMRPATQARQRRVCVRPACFGAGAGLYGSFWLWGLQGGAVMVAALPWRAACVGWCQCVACAQDPPGSRLPLGRPAGRARQGRSGWLSWLPYGAAVSAVYGTLRPQLLVCGGMEEPRDKETSDANLRGMNQYSRAPNNLPARTQGLPMGPWYARHVLRCVHVRECTLHQGKRCAKRYWELDLFEMGSCYSTESPLHDLVSHEEHES